MSQQELLGICPLCEGGHFDEFLRTKDFTVSEEFFTIVSCQKCGFRFTNPRPGKEKLGSYYESDNYISHANSANSLVNFVYKLARTFTLRWKYKLITRIKSRGLILDYGCGTGEFLGFCKDKGWRITGVEPNDKARQQAIELTGQKIFSRLSSMVTPKFDVITLWHVLEHIPDLNQTFAELKSLLDTAGYMLIAVPNSESHDAHLFKQHWAAYDVPRHLYHFTRKSMNKLVANHGMKVVDVIPMKLDSYYVSLLSNKIKFGKLKLFNSFITGLLSNIYAIRNTEYSSLIFVLKKQNE
jgi:SAM-dependent methyltransferase